MTSFEAAVGDIGYLVRELANQRRNVESAEWELGSIEQEIAVLFGKRLSTAKARLALTKAEAGELDAQLRLDALEQWERGDGDKSTIHPAIQIKEYTVLGYDLEEAIDYCRDHLPRALKLDKRKFESAAKVVEPDFVTIAKEARATIKRDLSKYLEDEIAS